MFGEVEARKDIWPQPKEKDGIAIFEMACPGWVGGNSDPVKVASQQFGFVDTILTCADDPIRQAASAHSLLFLVLAFCGGAATGTAQKMLNAAQPSSRSSCRYNYISVT